MFEVPAPIPGRMPIPRPIMAERKAFGSWPMNSAMLKPKPLTATGLARLSSGLEVLALSATLMISATANMPTSTVRMEKPAFNSTRPKVKRVVASTGAIPTVETAKPSTPANTPLAIEPEDSVAISVSEKTAMAKYSCGPKDSATCASHGAMNISAAIEIMVPMNEKTMPAPRALPPSPFSIIGPPSKVVAIEAGVPGILSRIAEIRPPEVAPTNNAISSAMPVPGSSP